MINLTLRGSPNAGYLYISEIISLQIIPKGGISGSKDMHIWMCVLQLYLRKFVPNYQSHQGCLSRLFSHILTNME